MSTKKTIAKSFTVSTIEDGVSVQAQYAPNANPTSGQIHTVWQEGDLYMRTRESDESAWSSWHKIVGESGDETDFSFGISQYKTTANASTAPSDISSWSDAPLAVTTEKPYLWAKVQQKSWNASTQAYVVDSTRYIRLTGEDGYTVEAQYAPNNNPTSSQIHTTWQDGDLYMRTKQSNETTWSSWHKIVGESGDETDYKFNISKSLTSSSATTEPANCYYPWWQDAPVAPIPTCPYLWMKIVKKTWNESTQSYDSGTARYARITGEPGTSPYFADLNNEMDAIQCKHDGSVITDQTVSTVISMWKGSAVEAFAIDNIYRNGTQLTWDGNNNGVWPRVSGSTVSLEFTTSASIADIDDFKITIHSYNDNTVTRELHFTINGVRANAIYRLVPSHSQIVKKKDGTYVPSGNVTCSVEKTENGSTSTPPSSEYTLEKSVNGGSYTTYSATAASSITSDLKFRLTVGGVVVDLETIPIVSDGNKGDGGVSYSIVFTKAAAKVDENNTVTAELAGYAYKYVGGVRSALESTTIRYGYILTDLETYKDDITDISGFFDAGIWFNGDDIHDYGKDSPSIFAAILIGGKIVHAEFITISKKGDTGSRGKTGRFYYYGGEFDNTDTTKTFKINDAETPYFSHGTNAVTGLPNCHVYNPSTNPSSDLTMAQMWTNSNQSWNNAPWQTFTNDFQYLMTRAVFSDQAYLGSFVVNADWLISQHGKVNHVASTAYKNFYPEFVNGGDLCENFDVDVNYILAGSAYFVGGKKYFIKVSGSSFSTGCQLNVRMYNGSSNVGNTINLRSSSPNGNIIFIPTTSGTYYLRTDCQSGGMTAKLTAYVDCFVPNFAVDGLTGKTYQNDAYIKGNIYRPALTINNSNYSTYAPKNQNNVYVIDLKKTGLNILLDFNLSTGTLLIDLPYGDEYIGAEVTIINNSNKCAYIETIPWGEGDASFAICGYSGYAHFKYVKVTNSLGDTVGKWWVLGSIYDPGNYVSV